MKSAGLNVGIDRTFTIDLIREAEFLRRWINPHKSASSLPPRTWPENAQSIDMPTPTSRHRPTENLPILLLNGQGKHFTVLSGDRMRPECPQERR
jgi:hypothetical protein